MDLVLLDLLDWFLGYLCCKTPSEIENSLASKMTGLLTLFGPLSGVLLWERCLELRIGYFMGLLWLVCIGLQKFALLSISLH